MTKGEPSAGSVVVLRRIEGRVGARRLLQADALTGQISERGR
jgi:hypothetical protein